MKPLMPDVTVNGETIASADISAEAQNHTAPENKPGLAWRAAAKAMVIRALLLQEAAKAGLTPAPQEIAPDKWETEEESLIRAVIETEITPETVSDAACRRIYDAQTPLFHAPSLFQPAHILFAASPDNPEARETARVNAQAALKELLANPKAFAGMAKDLSDCPSKDQGGELGQLSSGDTVPEFEAVLDIMDAGQIHPEPVETRFGFHIIRMDKKVTGDILPFEAVLPQIREKLEQAAWTKAAYELTNRLVAEAEISGIDMLDQQAA